MRIANNNVVSNKVIDNYDGTGKKVRVLKMKRKKKKQQVEFSDSDGFGDSPIKNTEIISDNNSQLYGTSS